MHPHKEVAGSFQAGKKTGNLGTFCCPNKKSAISFSKWKYFDQQSSNNFCKKIFLTNQIVFLLSELLSLIMESKIVENHYWQNFIRKRESDKGLLRILPVSSGFCLPGLDLGCCARWDDQSCWFSLDFSTLYHPFYIIAFTTYSLLSFTHG